MLTPHQFVAKWRDARLSERAGYQQHFLDLCELAGHPKPAEVDGQGAEFCFEKGAAKTGGGSGWADVWKRGHFAIEYKRADADLGRALAQVQRYAPALENPPLLVAATPQLIHIHTNFTNTVSDTHTIALEDIGTPENLQKLRWMFFEPERFKPAVTTAALTEQAAALFASLAQTLRGRGHPPQEVARFLDRLLFCFFAEDAGLLPARLVTRLIENGAADPGRGQRQLRQLFAAMTSGGDFGVETIDWFNGGLFDDDEALPLTAEDLAGLVKVSRLDWSNIEPSIFGTLFERGLDPDKRSQLGAHYTDPESILRIVRPVVVEPLLREWQTAKATIAAGIAAWRKGGRGSEKGRRGADAAYQGFMERLAGFRVLDPACGSGNFLYLALQALKDIEHRAMLEAEALGLPMGFAGFHTGPHNVMGIELNPYAAELARVTVWIGEIQWMLRHGMRPARDPILKPLDNIACRDAVMNGDGTEPDWPACDAIIGNPPFLGDKKMRGELGHDYVERLRRLYAGRVPGGADLVTYWFEKARAQIESGKARRAGLVATNSIRGGANRKVLERILATPSPAAAAEGGDEGRLVIFNAWSDEPWINEGAAVRVSLVCFAAHKAAGATLDGHMANAIHSDLTASGVSGTADLTAAQRLTENAAISFLGTQQNGPFTVPGETARAWLQSPNPHALSTARVVKPWRNGHDLTTRPSDRWIVDFGPTLSESDAALFQLAFEHVLAHVKPMRDKAQRDTRRRNWWRLGEAMPKLRYALSPLRRFIATPRVAKHRLFVWLDCSILPDCQLVAIARADDACFGILHSRFHELWALRLGTSLEDRPRYTPTTTFETFPFPAGLTPNLTPEAYANPHAEAIAAAARRLNELRENWLNPPEWVERVPEVVPSYPDRILPRPGLEAKLRKRTLTNLYNQRPAWLAHAHAALDAAVAAAYGWTDYTPAMPDEEILRRLLALNLEHARSIGNRPE